jgi:predicted nucleic acid-binding protein
MGRIIAAATFAFLAEGTQLSLYDASYLWLAHMHGAELVPLDDRLAQNMRRSK